MTLMEVIQAIAIFFGAVSLPVLGNVTVSKPFSNVALISCS
jgi:hypothetical protein